MVAAGAADDAIVAAAAVRPPPPQEALPAALQEARRLRHQEDPDATPYASKYAAADLLAALARRLSDAEPQAQQPAEPQTHQQQEQQQEQQQQQQQRTPLASSDRACCLGRVRIERGLVLLDTDLTAEAQRELEEGLAAPWPAGCVAACALQQQAHNALAGLWCDRGEYQISLSHLHTAEDLHQQIEQLWHQQQAQQVQQQQQQPLEQQAQQQQEPQEPLEPQAQQQEPLPPPPPQQQQQPQPQPAHGAAAWQAGLGAAADVERCYTTTLFYLAQVHGHSGDKLQSAAYCAATLNRQLKEGDVDVNAWVQNCLQLSGYFLDSNAFALSNYCCAAVEAALLCWHAEQRAQQQDGCGAAALPAAPGSPAPGAAAAAHQQQAGDPGGASKDAPLSRQAHEQDQQGKDQANKQQQPASPDKAQPPSSGSGCGGPSPALTAAMAAVLDADVAANVCLGFAKRSLYCLVASHEARVEGRPVAFPLARLADVPAVVCFDALPGLPPLGSLAWGADALAAGHEGALALARAALPWFRRALEYYRLDGWVTEHVNALFEMSNAYRCLAGFEADPHKRCVLHRSRAKLLAPLEGELSPTHYPGLSRSISLELGNVFREIADIKAAAEREPDKVAAARRSAAAHYRLFLASFKGDDGELPDTVEPEMEQHFLSGLFSLARVLQALPDPPDDSPPEAVLESVRLLDALVAYVQRHAIAAWQSQAGLASELAALLREKLSLTARLRDL